MYGKFAKILGTPMHRERVQDHKRRESRAQCRAGRSMSTLQTGRNVERAGALLPPYARTVRPTRRGSADECRPALDDVRGTWTAPWHTNRDEITVGDERGGCTTIFVGLALQVWSIWTEKGRHWSGAWLVSVGRRARNRGRGGNDAENSWIPGQVLTTHFHILGAWGKQCRLDGRKW